MSGNGTTNYSFDSGNAMPNALQTGTNGGMITNGMHSRSVGGKRSKSKRMSGGIDKPPTKKEVDAAEKAAKEAEEKAIPSDSNRILPYEVKALKKIAIELRAKADDLNDRYVKENQSNTIGESNQGIGGKKRKSNKNKKISRKTKKWFGLF